MEGLEILDKECSALGGLFQQVVTDMKNGVPHYEELVNKAAKLHSQLKSTILVLSSFLDTFQKIADAATNTKGATRDIGACLTRIVMRHKSMESRMKTLCAALLDCMILPMQDQMEDWRKSAAIMDKDHSKEYKKLRSDVKKRWETAHRLQKKNNKQKHGDQMQKAADASMAEVSKQLKNLQETEKNAVRKALIAERSRYCAFVSCLKPVLCEENGLVSEFQQLEEVTKKLSKVTEDPHKLPQASEAVIADISVGKDGSKLEGCPAHIPHFQTPPSSPSSLGSRKSSMCSISSAGSSGNGNGSAGQGNSPSHQAVNNARLRSQVSNGGGPQSGMGGAPPMRLSSVSSQDSGFTSQDTLHLQQQQQQLGLNEPPMGDRPHTISSAYEKGHQRPQLQPYTFSPPESTLTIPEDVTGEGGAINGSQDSLPPPPPPKPAIFRRPGSSASNASSDVNYRPPSLPGKSSMKATMAAARQQQILHQYNAAQGSPQHQQQHQQNAANQISNLPDFTVSKNDMIVPQPVYMNQNDLALLRQKKQQQQQSPDDSPDLKTPTAEDQLPVPEQKANGDGGSSTSESSLSSGYGSQNNVVRINPTSATSASASGSSSDPDMTNPQSSHNTQQLQNDGYGGVDMLPPHPAPLLTSDVSKYRTLSSSHLVSPSGGGQSANYNNAQFGTGQRRASQGQPQYLHSQSLDETSGGATPGGQFSMMQNGRPYSFASSSSMVSPVGAGTIHEVSEENLGALNPAGTATLRRTPSHAGTLLRGPPPPVMRRTSSVSGSPTEGTEGYDSYQGHEPPPPPAPAPHVARPGGQGSNSTTPRGSMENLPPPPPDLLHSDDDVGDGARPLSRASSKDHQELISKRQLSVADSVRQLQSKGHTPCSPRGLRRAHSMAAAGNTLQRQSQPQLGQQQPQQLGQQLVQQQQQLIPQQPGTPRKEQIYAPVAHLQQKIQQRQVVLQQPMNNVHQQQQLINQQQLAHPQQQLTQQNNAEAGSEYGFGMQFQQHQSQFLQHQQQQHQYPSQQQQLYQQQQRHQFPQQQSAVSPTTASMMQDFQSFSMTADPAAAGHQQQSFGVAAHDQIMRDIDTKLRQRPQPPPMQRRRQLQQLGNNTLQQQQQCDAQTALRVRRWIESRSVSDVRQYRPVLNQEIHQGFALRKTQNRNDRSAPRF